MRVYETCELLFLGKERENYNFVMIKFVVTRGFVPIARLGV